MPGSPLHVWSWPTVQVDGVREAVQRPVRGFTSKPAPQTQRPSTHWPAIPPTPPPTGPSLQDMAMRSVQTLPRGWQRPDGEASNPEVQKQRPPMH